MWLFWKQNNVLNDDLDIKVQIMHLKTRVAVMIDAYVYR